MATLREVRARITGVKKTQKITRAMKMVAAAKLRRSQAAILAARPYARSIGELLQHLSGSIEQPLDPLLVPRDVHSVALVVVTADRGLCGTFNANVVKAALAHLSTHYAPLVAEGKVSLYCIGRKGGDYFTKQHYPVAGRFIGVYNNLVFPEVRKIARSIVGEFLAGKFDKVEVVYNEFKSAARQQLVTEQFLPIPAESFGAVDAGGTVMRPVNYLYEPSGHAIAEAMVPRHIDFQLWRIVLESNAAEQGARMVAMENATENAEELIQTLQLQYNKARQASITKELLEVVSGAEALRTSG